MGNFKGIFLIKIKILRFTTVYICFNKYLIDKNTLMSVV